GQGARGVLAGNRLAGTRRRWRAAARAHRRPRVVRAPARARAVRLRDPHATAAAQGAARPRGAAAEARGSVGWGEPGLHPGEPQLPSGIMLGFARSRSPQPAEPRESLVRTEHD